MLSRDSFPDTVCSTTAGSSARRASSGSSGLPCVGSALSSGETAEVSHPSGIFSSTTTGASGALLPCSSIPSQVAATPPQSKPPSASAINRLRGLPTPDGDLVEEDGGPASPPRASAEWRSTLLNGDQAFFGSSA